MRILLAVLLFVWPLTTYATIEGTLWDPTIPGEGWTVESQNDLAFITYYMYEDGRPARAGPGRLNSFTRSDKWIPCGWVTQPWAAAAA